MVTRSPEVADAAGSIVRNLQRALLLLGLVAGSIWFYRSALSDPRQQDIARENEAIQACWRQRHVGENTPPDGSAASRCHGLVKAFRSKHGFDPH